MSRSTNIRFEHRRAFNALLSGAFANFALVSCFVNGEPASAIAVVEETDGEVIIRPLFVSITAEMQLADHDGRLA